MTLSAAGLAAVSQGANAQQAATQVAANQLPPIVVEGATLQAKPVAKAAPKPMPKPVVESVAEPAPAPKKVKKAAAPKAKPAAQATASDAPAPQPPGAADLEAANAADADVNGTSEATSSAGISSEKIGSAVSVVTGVELRARQIRNGGDALRSMPGVAVTRDAGIGGLTQVRIRGAEGNHTAVLIDGIEANDTTNGEFNFSDLSTDDIERIEVIRGPQSGIYGSGAIGGVVNIVTRGGRGPLTIRTMGEAGSFGTKAGSLGVSGGTDKAWGSVSISGRETNGFDISPVGNENDGSQLKTLNIRGGVQLLPGITLDLTLRHTNKQGDRDTQAPFPDPNGIQVDDPARFKETTWLGAAKLTWESFDGHLVQVAKATRNTTERNDTSVFFGTPSITNNEGTREDYSYTGTYLLDTPGVIMAHHYFTGLLEHQSESFTPKSDYGFGFAADGVERTRKLDAQAFEYRGEFADRLFVQGTVRHDDSSAVGTNATPAHGSVAALTRDRPSSARKLWHRHQAADDV
ncbi:MAG: TonB-dependent receptor [Hyphomicrobium sp.]|nr:TonB-dependent receptor [Hyphomicrobium sp.]